ncbi:MAG: rod shape-determining protein MreD [Eubacteriales bacterium]|nr:rod shape-determining protein MreD [Eubacteriales bacterium]
MTRFKYISIAIIIATLLQTTLMDYLAIGGIKPLLLLAVSICAVLDFGVVSGCITGVICGLIMDITSGGGVGLSSLILLYICIVCGLLCPKIFKEKVSVVVLFTLTSTFIFEFIYAFLLFFVWGKGSMVFLLFSRIIPESLYTSIFAIPIFLIFKRVKNVEWMDN